MSLFDQVILDHNRNPRNFHALEDATRVASGSNPLCGDELALYLRLEEANVTDASFLGHGCSVMMASASLLTEAVKGKSIAEARRLAHTLCDTLGPGETPAEFGIVEALLVVREYPVRMKCGLLPWKTLLNILP